MENNSCLVLGPNMSEAKYMLLLFFMERRINELLIWESSLSHKETLTVFVPRGYES